MRTTRIVLMGLLWLFANIGLAHEMRPASLNVQALGDDNFRVVWKVPARGEMRLSLKVVIEGAVPTSEVSAQMVGGAYLESWQFHREGGLTGAKLEIVGLSSTFTDVLVRLVDTEGRVSSARLTADKRSYIIPAEPSFGQLAATYTGLGVEHILLGIDHLLFVACLAFIAGFTRKLLWAVLGFTLAHSVTLALAALDIVRLPVPAVEAVIALSIVFLAVEIAKQQRDSLCYRYPVLVASSFGLLHGFGFAAVLTEIGLPHTEKLAALLFFNVGVEIGQLLFIAGLFVVLLPFYKMRPESRHRIEIAGSYIVGGIASLWLLQRIAVF